MVDKTYNVLVQFDSRNIKVKARNKREAKNKVKNKLKDTTAYKFLDKQLIFVDEL